MSRIQEYILIGSIIYAICIAIIAIIIKDNVGGLSYIGLAMTLFGILLTRQESKKTTKQLEELKELNSILIKNSQRKNKSHNKKSKTKNHIMKRGISTNTTNNSDKKKSKN